MWLLYGGLYVGFGYYLLGVFLEGGKRRCCANCFVSQPRSGLMDVHTNAPLRDTAVTLQLPLMRWKEKRRTLNDTHEIHTYVRIQQSSLCT